MSQIIGKYYTWGNLSIFFDKSGILSTPWAIIGSYQWLDNKTVKASWSRCDHILTFNNTFTEFNSIRIGDNLESKGHSLVEHGRNSTIPSIQIHYKDLSSDLCFLAKKYNLDKSSQRENPGPGDGNHCHPYSLLYDNLFRRMRGEALNFCEIGIAEGRSLLMWEEYFPKANIYGFEKYPKWLDNWKNKYSDKKRITVNGMDVKIDSDITKGLKATGVLFDCIIDDSSHFFYDMVRIIKCAIPFVKPGGMIVIEDIRKSFDEAWFYNELKDVLNEFQSVFFVDLDHNRRNSGCVNNDKMLVLIKNGPQYFNYSLI